MTIRRRDFLRFAGATALTPAILTVGLPGRARAQAAEVLTIAQTNDILSLDPANHGNNSTESALVNIYDYLVSKTFTEDGMQFGPSLATSWETEDFTRWVFDLRDDVTWHDGTPFTAEDVKFTIERTQADSSLRSSSKFHTIASANVLAPHRLEIVTSRRDALLLHSFVGNGAGILPKAAFEAAANPEAFFAKPVGTGPYLFDTWVRGDRLELVANPNWWGGTPHWQRVVIRGISESATRVAEGLTGGVDIAVNIPPEDVARIRENDTTSLSAFNIARNFALHVRTDAASTTHDKRVREAIDYAINREEIVQYIVDGFATPTRGLFPPEIPGYHPGLTAENSYDPDRARALLEEADAVGVKITVNAPSGRWVKDREVAEAIVGYLQDAGFDARLEILEWSILNNRLQADTLGEVYLWGMGSYTDASWLLNLQALARFHPNWSNEEFTRLSNEIGDAPTEDARLAMARRAQEIVTEDRLRIGVLYPQAIYAVNARVKFSGRFDEMIPAEQVRRA